MTNEQIREFLVAGRVIFTLDSNVTGKHYVFKSQKIAYANAIQIHTWNAGGNYIYLGAVSIKDRLVYRETAKSRPSYMHLLMHQFFMQVSNDIDFTQFSFNVSNEAAELLVRMSDKFDWTMHDTVWYAEDNEAVIQHLNDNCVKVLDVCDQEVWLQTDGSFITRFEDMYCSGDDFTQFEIIGDDCEADRNAKLADFKVKGIPCDRGPEQEMGRLGIRY